MNACHCHTRRCAKGVADVSLVLFATPSWPRAITSYEVGFIAALTYAVSFYKCSRLGVRPLGSPVSRSGAPIPA
ncbi:hypothetical protein P8C59_004549 [Phyllachora maydis]|uniref:Uncharacterized protein n=1 Tax=Phyllachora maydis TaxID=1825666 RepID=A0AAD9I4A8_9PEZI|nr:hypothetical protein P8C59_004549 [Phyllachora maydis]